MFDQSFVPFRSFKRLAPVFSGKGQLVVSEEPVGLAGAMVSI